ncbi:MAG TPA: hypothetical protein VG387_21365 [Rhizomicrobium sp.]|jgi:hypothetical protein|nr:hypothetical protein [Rhizomicrobium sp.]
MKKIAILGALLVASASAPAALAQDHSGPSPRCLQSEYIDRTDVVSPKQINFRMKDGTVYRSDLATPCTGLRFNGFVYVTPMDEVCGGFQSIRVLQTNQVCVLGKFSLEKAPHHAS